MRWLLLIPLICLEMGLGGCALPRVGMEYAELRSVVPLPKATEMHRVELTSFAYQSGGRIRCELLVQGKQEDTIAFYRQKLKDQGWDLGMFDWKEPGVSGYRAARKIWWTGEEAIDMSFQEHETDNGPVTHVYVWIAGNYMFSKECSQFLDHSMEKMMGGGPVWGTILFVPNIILLPLL